MKLNYLFNDFKDCERAAKTSLLKSKQRRRQQLKEKQVQQSFQHVDRDSYNKAYSVDFANKTNSSCNSQPRISTKQEIETSQIAER